MGGALTVWNLNASEDANLATLSYKAIFLLNNVDMGLRHFLVSIPSRAEPLPKGRKDDGVGLNVNQGMTRKAAILWLMHLGSMPPHVVPYAQFCRVHYATGVGI